MEPSWPHHTPGSPPPPPTAPCPPQRPATAGRFQGRRLIQGLSAAPISAIPGSDGGGRRVHRATKDHPEFKDVFEHLARQGRSDRIQLVLATQSLTGGVAGSAGLQPRWRTPSRPPTAQDSMAAIETKDAYHLTKIGQGYLKVGGAEPIFESAHVYDYFPPTSARWPGRSAIHRGHAVGDRGSVSRQSVMPTPRWLMRPRSKLRSSATREGGNP